MTRIIINQSVPNEWRVYWYTQNHINIISFWCVKCIAARRFTNSPLVLMCNSHCRHILYYAGRSCVDLVCFWLRISFVVNTPTARLIHYCPTTHHAGNRASSPVQTPTGHLVISLHRPVVHTIIIVNSFTVISHIIRYCQSVADILISLRLVFVNRC
jgi:hypothetical protein